MNYEQSKIEAARAARASRIAQAQANATLAKAGCEHLIHGPYPMRHAAWEREPRLNLKRSNILARRVETPKEDRLEREAELMTLSGWLMPKRVVKA